MPKFIDPESGEEVEITMEKFIEGMKTGSVSIQQTVTHADGTTTSINIFGDTSNDGVDRSVNIFVDKDTFGAFLVHQIKKIDGKGEDILSVKDTSEIFEMHIDFTDSATMVIFRKTADTASVNAYIRDEQRAPLNHYLQISRSWKVKNDGSILCAHSELAGDDETAYLLLSFLGMRQFLRASGKLEELKKLGNRGSGVILHATGQADDATATIVIGHKRPDLPCYFMGLGEAQMMRPYIDELVESSAKEAKASEDGVKQEELADQSGIKTIKRKVGPTKAEEDAKTAGDIVKQWEKACQDVKAKRAQLVEQWVKEAELEYNKQVASCDAEWKKDAAELDKKADELQSKLDDLQRELQATGVFALSKKKELKCAIEQTQNDIASATTERLEKEEKYNKAKEKLKDDKEGKIQVFPAMAENEIPDPPKPPEVLAKEQAEAEAEEKKKLEALEDEILMVLYNYGEATTTEIIKKLYNPPSDRYIVSSCLRKLRDKGKVTTRESQGKTYFKMRF